MFFSHFNNLFFSQLGLVMLRTLHGNSKTISKSMSMIFTCCHIFKVCHIVIKFISIFMVYKFSNPIFFKKCFGNKRMNSYRALYALFIQSYMVITPAINLWFKNFPNPCRAISFSIFSDSAKGRNTINPSVFFNRFPNFHTYYHIKQI